MTNSEFKYWIEGFLTLSSVETISPRQWSIIQNHANLVKAIEGHLIEPVHHFLKQANELFLLKQSLSYEEFKMLYFTNINGNKIS